MPSLQFDGIDDRLVFTTLSDALRNLPVGAYTTAMLLSRAAWNGGSDGWDIHYAFNTTPTSTYGVTVGCEWQGGSYLSVQDGGNNRNWQHGLGTLTDVPLLVVISKADGTVAPQISVLNLNTGVWTHGQTLTTADNRAALPSTGGLIFGGYPGNAWVEFLAGKIGVFAAWQGVAMDQAQRMECGDALSTSGLWNHSAGQPVSLIEFTSDAPTDLAGGVAALAEPTTAAESADDLGWTYDGIGGAGPEQHSGSAVVSGGGNVSASGTKHASGSAVASAGGTASATGRKLARGSGAASGAGATAAFGTKRAAGSAAVTGSGASSATGRKLAHGSAVVSGGGSVTARGSNPAALRYVTDLPSALALDPRVTTATVAARATTLSLAARSTAVALDDRTTEVILDG